MVSVCFCCIRFSFYCTVMNNWIGTGRSAMKLHIFTCTILSAVLAIIMFPSICLSITSHVLLRWLNLGARKQSRMIVQEL